MLAKKSVKTSAFSLVDDVSSMLPSLVLHFIKSVIPRLIYVFDDTYAQKNGILFLTSLAVCDACIFLNFLFHFLLYFLHLKETSFFFVSRYHEKRRMATESGGDETGDETGSLGGPGDETSDKNAATAGDERDGGEYKEGSVHLTLTLTTIFCRCQHIVQLPPVPKPIQLKQTTCPKTAKTAKKCFKGFYITTIYFVLCIVCCVVYGLLCITVL